MMLPLLPDHVFHKRNGRVVADDWMCEGFACKVRLGCEDDGLALGSRGVNAAALRLRLTDQHQRVRAGMSGIGSARHVSRQVDGPHL